MTEAQKQRLKRLGDHYKERVYAGLFQVLEERLENVDWDALAEYDEDEILQMLYMQGVADALENFRIEDLLDADDPGGDPLEA